MLECFFFHFQHSNHKHSSYTTHEMTSRKKQNLFPSVTRSSKFPFNSVSNPYSLISPSRFLTARTRATTRRQFTREKREKRMPHLLIPLCRRVIKMHQHIVKIIQSPQPDQPIYIRHRTPARREQHQALEFRLTLLVRIKHVAKQVVIETSLRPYTSTRSNAFPRLATALVRGLQSGGMVGRAGFGGRSICGGRCSHRRSDNHRIFCLRCCCFSYCSSGSDDSSFFFFSLFPAILCSSFSTASVAACTPACRPNSYALDISFCSCASVKVSAGRGACRCWVRVGRKRTSGWVCVATWCVMATNLRVNKSSTIFISPKL